MKNEGLLTKEFNHYQLKNTRRLKVISILLLFISFLGCSQKRDNVAQETLKIHQIIDDWHDDAKNADFDAFFNRMSESASYVGTDAKETWNKQEFKIFAKPFFDKKQTWDFKKINRNIYFSKNVETAWFDEVLETWMGTCRGSGVLEKEKDSWLIKHYVLSVTVPNDKIEKVMAIKKDTVSVNGNASN